MHEEHLTQRPSLSKLSSYSGSVDFVVVTILLFCHGLLCMAIESYSEGIDWIVEKCIPRRSQESPYQKIAYKSQDVAAKGRK